MNNLNILQGKSKSGKTHLALILADNYHHVLYFTEDDSTSSRYKADTLIRFQTFFNIETLERTILYHNINATTAIGLVIVDCGVLLSPQEKEIIADIAVKTNTKIIIVETIKTYGEQ